MEEGLIGVIVLAFLTIYFIYAGIYGLVKRKFYANIFTPFFPSVAFGGIVYEGNHAAYPSIASIFIGSLIPLGMLGYAIDGWFNIETGMPIAYFSAMVIALGFMMYFRFKHEKENKLKKGIN